MVMTYANGVRLHYQQRGRGPDVLMVHGLAANLAFWWPYVDQLVRDGFRVTLYDLRGHGKSDMPPRGYTNADLARDLLALMDGLGVYRPHLVGHSLGGEVALYLGAVRPDRVRSLTLADSRVRSLQPVNRLADWPQARVMAETLRRAGVIVPDDDPETGQRLLEELARTGRRNLVHALGGGPVPPAVGFGAWGRRGAAQWLRLLGTTTARADLRSSARPTAAQLPRISLPVLAVYGEWSPCMPSLRGLQRALPRCRARVLPGAGHFHPVTRPQGLAQVLYPFLRGLESGERIRAACSEATMPQPAPGRASQRAHAVTPGAGEAPR